MTKGFIMQHFTRTLPGRPASNQLSDHTEHQYRVQQAPSGQSARALRLVGADAEDGAPILTRFGELVDVRRRGALRMGRFAGTQTRTVAAPAVVRLWNDDQCRELSAHQARTLAAQLLAAATLVDAQNQH
jgi:hypothetical protein